MVSKCGKIEQQTLIKIDYHTISDLCVIFELILYCSTWYNIVNVVCLLSL